MVDRAQATERLAALAVELGANVQPGQIVAVSSYVGKQELTRAIARAAYRRGATYVDALYFDQWIKRERILHAAEETLSFVPPWFRDRLLWLSDEHAARISLSGPHAPTALDGLDPARAGIDLLPWLPEVGPVVDARTTNWTIVPAPTAAWAEHVYPGLEPEEALERLWEAVIHICRLESDDPTAAWAGRMAELADNAARLDARRFDALHLYGPGTDLTVGLFPSSTWNAAGATTVDGLRHYPNLPTEETFTTPDPARVDGRVTATMPLELYGAIISGLHVAFEGGRVTRIDADEGVDVLRAVLARDEGAGRLGEIALVDGSGRIGPLRTVFFDTLIDENAASHIALGHGYERGVRDPADAARVNQSSVHIDFMIGSPELAVDGITHDGAVVPVLRDGIWQL
jgi:aminopeptidase